MSCYVTLGVNHLFSAISKIILILLIFSMYSCLCDSLALLRLKNEEKEIWAILFTIMQ